MKNWERRRERDIKNEYTEETVKLIPSVSIWFVLLMVMGLGGTAVTLALKPAFMGFEREIVQQSPQYVESKRTLLNGLLQDWNQLEVEILEATQEVADAKRGQQAAIVNRMRDEVQRIPESEVPTSVSDFLSTTGG